MGWKRKIPEKNHLTTRKQNLAGLTYDPSISSNPQRWNDDERFRALKISDHSATGAAMSLLAYLSHLLSAWRRFGSKSTHRGHRAHSKISHIFSSSWCQGLTAACDFGTPWTFLWAFMNILQYELFLRRTMSICDCMKVFFAILHLISDYLSCVEVHGEEIRKCKAKMMEEVSEPVPFCRFNIFMTSPYFIAF